MRKEFQLTPDEKAELLAVMRPVPMIMLQCGEPPSLQDNANHAWIALGKKRGFDGMTVKASARGIDFFTAEVVATPVEVLLERLETSYNFQCEAGSLKHCIEWQRLKEVVTTSRSVA